MRVSDALSPVRELDVQFAEDVLHVSYRPISYSLEELERIQEESVTPGNTPAERRDRIRRLAALISKLVISWDLTDENDVVVDPTDVEALRLLPLNIFTEILAAVRRDQQVGEAHAPSAAS